MNQETLSTSRVRWQCRRGMLELDLLLLGFFDSCYSALTEVQKQNFIDLLALPDQVLYGYLIGRDKPEPAFQAIIDQIRQKSCKK